MLSPSPHPTHTSSRLTSPPSPSPRPRTASPTRPRTAPPSTRTSAIPASPPAVRPVSRGESKSTPAKVTSPTPAKTKYATLSHRTKSREKERSVSADFTYVDSSFAFEVKRTMDHGSQARVMLRQLHNRDIEGSVEWIIKGELQLAFDRLEHEKAVFAKKVTELEKEKEDVDEDRRILTLESMEIYKQKALLQTQRQELEEAREEFKQEELSFCREKMRVFVQSDTLATARADIIQERLDVDKDYDTLERRAADNEKKMQRAQKETNAIRAEMEKKVESFKSDNERLQAENKRLLSEIEALREENTNQKRELANIHKNQSENIAIMRKLDALESALKTRASPSEISAVFENKEVGDGYDEDLDGLAEHENNGESTSSLSPSLSPRPPLPPLPTNSDTPDAVPQNELPTPPGSPAEARKERMSKLRAMLHTHAKKTGGWKFGKT